MKKSQSIALAAGVVAAFVFTAAPVFAGEWRTESKPNYFGGRTTTTTSPSGKTWHTETRKNYVGGGYTTTTTVTGDDRPAQYRIRIKRH